MIVIADTTPLISLLKIGRINLLESLFGEILIPSAVYNEAVSNSRYKKEAKEIQQASFIRTVDIKDHTRIKTLRSKTGLDMGESEAIILSMEMGADILLMDEAKGRKAAAGMGLKIIGTIGILMAAYEEQMLTSLDVLECIRILKENRRYIRNGLDEQLKRKIDQKIVQQENLEDER